MVHYINTYFINIGKSKINRASNANRSGGQVGDVDHNSSWAPDEFSIQEVIWVVKDINVSKSSGIQDISSFIIKESFTILVKQVTFMLNLSLRTSTFPAAWKNDTTKNR